MFNPSQFLNTELTAGFATDYIPIPDGEWGPAQCTDIKIRTNKSRETGEEFHSLDTNWEIMDEELKRVMGIERNPVCRNGFILEFDSHGQLKKGPGENVKLGRLLEAVGMNKDGEAVLLGNLKGQTVATVRTKSRVADDGNTYTDIIGFASE